MPFLGLCGGKGRSSPFLGLCGGKGRSSPFLGLCGGKGRSSPFLGLCGGKDQSSPFLELCGGKDQSQQAHLEGPPLRLLGLFSKRRSFEYHSDRSASASYDRMVQL